MSKTLLGIFIGAFVCAVTYEVMKRNNPDFMEKLEKKVQKKVDAMLEEENIKNTARA
ncbi:MAG: hypothetical protein OEU95_09530 [Nitrospirota bacterium]|nr:hypothetical protein [Nitrospirota bacterium]